MKKAELRNQLKKARLELSDAERISKSRAIVNKLTKASDWNEVKTLHYFEPIDELLEPDTREFTNFIEDNYPNIKLFTPRKVEGEWELIAAKGGEIPKDFDVVIVPMLGFDPKTLHRIGYGGGYYDKFLAAQPKAKKIGVCFELGQTKDLPIETHDIPVDLIVTEKQVLK